MKNVTAPEEWFFRQELPAHGRGIDQKIDYSAGNYQLLEKESTRRLIILPGITSSWKRNRPED
jgi:hypothetical protein